MSKFVIERILQYEINPDSDSKSIASIFQLSPLDPLYEQISENQAILIILSDPALY
jgi:hypothetical protein